MGGQEAKKRARLLKVGAAVLVLLRLHQVAQVVNQRQRPRVLGGYLVFGGELEAAAPNARGGSQSPPGQGAPRAPPPAAPRCAAAARAEGRASWSTGPALGRWRAQRLSAWLGSAHPRPPAEPCSPVPSQAPCPGCAGAISRPVSAQSVARAESSSHRRRSSLAAFILATSARSALSSFSFSGDGDSGDFRGVRPPKRWRAGLRSGLSIVHRHSRLLDTVTLQSYASLAV